MPNLINALRALRRPVVFAAAIAVSAGAAELAAQVSVGQTIRITTSQNRGVYQLRALRADTVVVQAGDTTLAFALSDIERIELGSRRGAERLFYGALFGAGIGAATGAVLGLASGDDCDGTTTFCFGWSAGEKATTGAVVLGAIGGIGGAIIGAQNPWSWKRIGPENLAIRAAPARDGLSLRVSFRPGRTIP
ncbi:MAG: hypothetical protein ACN0LA_01495 [Candidatus Longimicrobiales bacterium M2_2A_002]